MTTLCRSRIPQVVIDVPDGVSGDWSVESFVVDEEGARRHNFYESLHRGRMIVTGTYKKLCHQGALVMSNTPAEIEDLFPFFDQAQGRVLINGLGLGVALKFCLGLKYANGNPRVKLVTVIERSPDVIKLVGPTYSADPRLTIIEADALTWTPPRGVKYDCVWHDIWPTIPNSDDFPSICALRKKYLRRCTWQGVWCDPQEEDY